MKIFLAGGESRHWLHENSPCKENGVKHENLPSRRVLSQHGKCNQADSMGGNIPSEVNNEIIFGKPTHVSEIQGGKELATQALGGIFSNADISCRGDTVQREEKYRGGL